MAPAIGRTVDPLVLRALAKVHAVGRHHGRVLLLLQHLHLSGVALRLHAGLVVQGSVLLGAVLSNRTQNKV